MNSEARSDLPNAVWRKSRRSSAESSNCVEVARLADAFAVRDSKNPSETPLIFARPQWTAFVDSVKANQFDLA